MKKISLQIFAFFISILSVWGQENTESNESNYEKRNLKIEEVNILGSYYTQDGNNSGVTGGIGTEKLTDFSSSIDIKMVKPTAKGNKHLFGVNVGVDYYTSASSDNIDPLLVTSPSYSDTRVYPTLSYAFENTNNNSVIGGNVSFSSEFDYISRGGQLNYSKAFNKKQTEWVANLNVFFDELQEIKPYELRDSGKTRNYQTKTRNTFNLSNAIHQTINSRIQMALILDIAYQNGYLSTPFNRFYTKGASAAVLEVLPDSRIKVPVGLRGNIFLSDKFILRNFYRFYWDNWDIVSNTFQTELNAKVNNTFTLSPSVRLYQQTGSKYFYEKNELTQLADFRTSDFDLSNFQSIFAGLGLKIQPKNGIISPLFHSIELKYGYYARTNGLNAHLVSANIKIK
jgi:hypothetical protein